MTALTAARRRFELDVAGDSLVALHDVGSFRYLRMGFPGSPLPTYEVSTWPGHLAVDVPGVEVTRARFMFVFPAAARRRRPDAFDLFDLDGEIDPVGWARLVPADRPAPRVDDPAFLWCCCAIAHCIAEYRRSALADQAVAA